MIAPGDEAAGPSSSPEGEKQVSRADEDDISSVVPSQEESRVDEAKQQQDIPTSSSREVENQVSGVDEVQQQDRTDSQGVKRISTLATSSLDTVVKGPSPLDISSTSGLDNETTGPSQLVQTSSEVVVSIPAGLAGETAYFSATDDSSSTAAEEREAQSLPFYKLFMFADWLDVLLMSLGTLGAVGNGLARPLMTLIFGQIANAFGENASDPSKLAHQVSQVSLRYVYLGLGTGAAAFLETAFWMCAGERQAARIRALYFKSILRQDVSFFDKGTSSGEVLGRMSDDTILIQDAIGEKVGKFVQLMSTFFGGFILAYTKGWKLALVVSSALPLLVIAGATMAIMISKMANRGQMAYAEAGNIVEQVVSGIRTVASFTGEDKAAKDYEAALEKVYKAGVYQGLSTGFGMGFTLLTLYLSYGLALWYGSKLILHSNYTGGIVINVMLSLLMGGM